MAQKKITDLQLISELVDELSVPSDNGVQSYRFTIAQIKAYLLANGAIQLAMLDDDIFHGLTGVTPVAADYLPLIDTSDSNKTKKATIANLRNAVVRAVNSTDTAAADDETLYLSGASFTETLPAGVTGKRMKLVHSGTSLTQVYSIATTGGASIKVGGITYASGDAKLYTNGETLTLEFDGTDWWGFSHYAVTDWISVTPTSLVAKSGGTPTNPTKPSGISIDQRWWRRLGRHMYVRDEYRQTNTTGANSGSGDYASVVPGSQVMDTTKMTVYATIEGNGGFSMNGRLGDCSIGHSTNEGEGAVVPYDSTHVRYFIIFTDGATPSRGVWSDACFGLASSATIYMSSKWDAPIAAWMP